MTVPIDFQFRNSLFFKLRKLRERLGAVSGILMVEHMMHLGLHLADIAQDLRGGHNAGDGDTLMTIDVAVDARKVKEDSAEASSQKYENQAKGESEFLPD